MRVSERAVEVMPIIDKINFALRSQTSIDLNMKNKFDKGKAVDAQFTHYRQVVADMKTAYKTEKGFLKMSIVKGQILDWSG